MKIRAFTFCIIMTIISSCSQPSKEIFIDNPSDQVVNVSFAKLKNLQLQPNEYAIREVTFGKNQLTINDQDPIDIYLDPDEDYVINPTLQSYYIENIIYFESERAEKKYHDDFGEITSMVGGLEFHGDFRKIEPNVLIQKNWVYGLEDNPKEHINLKKIGPKGYVITKHLRRESDIHKLYGDQLLEFYKNHLKE